MFLLISLLIIVNNCRKTRFRKHISAYHITKQICTTELGTTFRSVAPRFLRRLRPKAEGDMLKPRGNRSECCPLQQSIFVY